MKTFHVLTKIWTQVTLDETKFTPEFMEEFNKHFYQMDDLEEHAAHLGSLYARGVANGWSDEFIEGYGPVKEMGIEFEPEGEEFEIDEWA